MLIVKLEKFKNDIDNGTLKARDLVEYILGTCDDATSNKTDLDNIALADIEIEHKAIIGVTIDKELYVAYIELAD